jgi:hypothetical protein
MPQREIVVVRGGGGREREIERDTCILANSGIARRLSPMKLGNQKSVRWMGKRLFPIRGQRYGWYKRCQLKGGMSGGVR